MLRTYHLQTVPNNLRSQYQADGDSRQTGAESHQHAGDSDRSLHRLHRVSDAVKNVRSLRREIRELALR